MAANFEKWMENEKNWIDNEEKKLKKQTRMYLPAFPVIGALGLGLIGLLAGGGMELALSNALIGCIAGIVMIPIFMLLMLSSYPAKRFKKSLKANVEDALSPAEREAFAAQMLGEEEAVKTITWINDKKLQDKVCIAKDFVLKSSGDGYAALVMLDKVKKIKTVTESYSVTTYGGGAKITQSAVSYDMHFYYSIADNKKDNYDVGISFPNTDRRFEAMELIREAMGAERPFVEEAQS